MTDDGTCKFCKVGYYLLDIPDLNKKCKKCPPNAICEGGNSIYPKAGYSRPHELSESVIKCLSNDICLEGNSTYPLGICTTGYEGFACSHCQSKYTQDHHSVCNKCSQYEFVVLKAVFWICWTTMVAVVISTLIEQFLVN